MLRRDLPTFVALCAASAEAVALCASVALPAADEVPEWVHLLPTGEIRTRDNRGPYRVRDAAAVIAASLQQMQGAGVVDENHATDLAAPRGESAPARGWIVALEARADGIWGKVDWTPPGRRLMRHRSYRGISPVISHDAAGNVSAILRASLINRPNLVGLATLHQENDMDFITKLRQALGLAETADEEAILAAIGKVKQTTTHAVLDPIAKAVGLQAGAAAAAVLAGVEAVAGQNGEATIVALQAELATVTTQLNGLLEGGKREKAVAFVDGAIKAGRVGVKPQRDRYVTMHMADPANTEALIAALPILGGGGQLTMPQAPAANGEVSLNAEQRSVATMLGIDADAYKKTVAAEAAQQESF